MIVDQINLKSTAKIIWDSWKEYRVLSTLPRNLVPRNRFEAYTVQSYFEEFSQQGLFGWKIAATQARLGKIILVQLVLWQAGY